MTFLFYCLMHLQVDINVICNQMMTKQITGLFFLRRSNLNPENLDKLEKRCKEQGHIVSFFRKSYTKYLISGNNAKEVDFGISRFKECFLTVAH